MTVKGTTSASWAKDTIVVKYGPQFTSGTKYPAVVTAELEIPSQIDPRQGCRPDTPQKQELLNITKLDIASAQPW
jgi:hypothetical protein